jgi:hypothetical protein
MVKEKRKPYVVGNIAQLSSVHRLRWNFQLSTTLELYNLCLGLLMRDESMCMVGIFTNEKLYLAYKYIRNITLCHISMEIYSSGGK